MPPPGLPHRDFGGSAALRGDVLVLSAPGSSAAGFGTGWWFIYQRSAGGWALAQQIAAGPDEWVNYGLALSGDELALALAPVGVRLLERSAAGFSDAELIPWPPDAYFFGRFMARWKDTLAIAASLTEDPLDAGTVYIYERADGGWSLRQQLVAPPPSAPYTFFDGFGIIAMSDERMLTGATGVDDVAVLAGAVYAYERRGQQWQLVQTLLPPAEDPVPLQSAGFGVVALDGDVALVGADGLRRAYLYRHGSHGWQLEQTLVEPGGFGSPVAIQGNTAVVAAGVQSDGKGTYGSVYIYRLALTDGEACSTDEACLNGACGLGTCCTPGCVEGDPRGCVPCPVIDSGCGCRLAGHAAPTPERRGWLLLGAALLAGRTRRRREARPERRRRRSAMGPAPFSGDTPP